MEIDYQNIIDTYGEDMLENIKDNKDIVKNNIDYLRILNFDDIESIFERYAPIFLYDPNEFKEKIDNLIKKIGSDYVNMIENDLSLLEELL